jgi:hypothetical protein
MFDNRMLRKVLGSKRDEETWELRRLHNEELHEFCLVPTIIRAVT